MFSNPGQIWSGRLVFCLGCGPSLKLVSNREWEKIKQLQDYFGAIVLGINSSFKLAREKSIKCDALYFTDSNWFDDNEEEVKKFKGLKFTASRRAKEKYLDLMRIETNGRKDFSLEPPMRDGRSSGHRAVSLSIMLGAKVVVLLGYDMRIVNNRSHYHDEYHNTESEKSYRDEFVPSFNGWHEDALKVGCEIINLTPDSAVKEFPSMRLDKFLRLELNEAYA